MKQGIACAGNCVADTIKHIEHYPSPGNLTSIQSIAATTGGIVPNCLLTLANIDPDLPLTAAGLVGNDANGDYIIGRLAEAHIDTTHLRRHATLGTSFTDAMSLANGGERTFFHYRGANAAFGPDYIDLNSISADILHIGYILLLDAFDRPDVQYGTVMARLLHDAQKRGLRTSIDVVSEQGERFAQLVPPALKYTDYCIINEIEASAATGIACRDDSGRLTADAMERLCRALRGMGVGRWIVVHCPEGAFALDESGAYIAQPSLALPKELIMGKTGAGDAFCAAVLYGAYKALPLSDALMLAHAAAACCLMTPGTQGVRRERELWRLIELYGWETI